MELKPIRTKKDYQAALTEVEQLWDAPAKSAEADRLPANLRIPGVVV